MLPSLAWPLIHHGPSASARLSFPIIEPTVEAENPSQLAQKSPIQTLVTLKSNQGQRYKGNAKDETRSFLIVRLLRVISKLKRPPAGPSSTH